MGSTDANLERSKARALGASNADAQRVYDDAAVVERREAYERAQAAERARQASEAAHRVAQQSLEEQRRGRQATEAAAEAARESLALERQRAWDEERAADAAEAAAQAALADLEESREHRKKVLQAQEDEAHTAERHRREMLEKEEAKLELQREASSPAYVVAKSLWRLQLRKTCVRHSTELQAYHESFAGACERAAQLLAGRTAGPPLAAVAALPPGGVSDAGLQAQAEALEAAHPQPFSDEQRRRCPDVARLESDRAALARQLSERGQRRSAVRVAVQQALARIDSYAVQLRQQVEPLVSELRRADEQGEALFDKTASELRRFRMHTLAFYEGTCEDPRWSEGLVDSAWSEEWDRVPPGAIDLSLCQLLDQAGDEPADYPELGALPKGAQGLRSLTLELAQTHPVGHWEAVNAAHRTLVTAATALRAWQTLDDLALLGIARDSLASLCERALDVGLQAAPQTEDQERAQAALVLYAHCADAHQATALWNTLKAAGLVHPKRADPVRSHDEAQGQDLGMLFTQGLHKSGIKECARVEAGQWTYPDTEGSSSKVAIPAASYAIKTPAELKREAGSRNTWIGVALIVAVVVAVNLLKR